MSLIDFLTMLSNITKSTVANNYHKNSFDVTT